MNHNLVNVQPYFIRKMSRERLAGRWGLAILGYIIYMFFLNFVPDICGVLIPQGRVTIVEEIGYSIPIIKYLYDLILAGPFMLGATVFLLKIVRNGEVEPSYIFSGFEYFLKSFLLALLMSLFIMFWTMLFIIPGFIAFYRYRLAFYILADDPRKSPMQCLAESKYMMVGNKGALFSLDFSFIGWLLLAAVIPGVLVTFEITSPSFTGEPTLMNIIVGFLLDIPTFIAMLYLRTSSTIFYEFASGRINMGNNPNMGFNNGPNGPSGPNGGNGWNNPNNGQNNGWNNSNNGQNNGWNNPNNGQYNHGNQQGNNNFNGNDYQRGQGGDFNNYQPGSDWNYGNAENQERNYYNEEAVRRAKESAPTNSNSPSQDERASMAQQDQQPKEPQAQAEASKVATEELKEVPQEEPKVQAPQEPVQEKNPQETIIIPPTEEKKEEEVIEAVEDIDRKIEVEQGYVNQEPVVEENATENESIKEYNDEMISQFKDIFSKNSENEDHNE